MNSILTIFETTVVEYLLLASVAAAILVAVAWGLVRLGKVKSSVNRHLVWLFTLLAIVLLPGIWLHGPKMRLTVLPAGSSPVETAPQFANIDVTAGPMVKNVAGASVDLPAANAVPEAGASPSFGFPPVMTLLAWGWCMGFLLMLIRLTVGGINLRELLRSAEPVSNPMRLNTDGKYRARLLISQRVECPVCFGLLRPTILIPKKMYDDASPEDLQMILRHELAHIERRDCWVNLFQRLEEAALFFHPLVWYASFQLTQYREELCDQHVITGGASTENYVQLLTRIARQGFEKRTFQAVALFEGRLLSRIKSLLGLGGTVRVKASGRAMGILAAAAILCVAVGTVRLDARSDAVDAPDTPDQPETEVSFRPQKERLGRTGNRPIGDCSLSGRVVSATTGDPIEAAMIQLFYTDTSDGIIIETASDGSFFFEDIPGGQYSLKVIRAEGFQGAIYNPENNEYGGLAFFPLVEGEERSGIVFELEPAYSISGRVLGADGQPITGRGLIVRAWKAQEEGAGGSANYESPHYETENLVSLGPDGFYSLDGLSGSPVFVMVSDGKSTEKDDAMPPCYYPGTVSRDEALLVDFSSGSSIENIDIQWVRKGDVVLEGTVSDAATGAPVANALVAVHHTDMLFDRITVYTDEAGHYRIESLGSGRFLAHVDAMPWGYVRARQPVELASGQSAQLDFVLKPAAAISGVFIDEGGKPVSIYENASGYAHMTDPVAENDTGVSWSGPRNKYSPKGFQGSRERAVQFYGGQGDYNNCQMVFPTDSSFLIEAILPGETSLSFNPKEEGMEVKKILYNGENIMQVKEASEEATGFYDVIVANLETRPGETVEGVAIVLGPLLDSP